jgi:hypothetical protein
MYFAYYSRDYKGYDRDTGRKLQIFLNREVVRVLERAPAERRAGTESLAALKASLSAAGGFHNLCPAGKDWFDVPEGDPVYLLYYPKWARDHSDAHVYVNAAFPECYIIISFEDEASGSGHKRMAFVQTAVKRITTDSNMTRVYDENAGNFLLLFKEFAGIVKNFDKRLLKLEKDAKIKELTLNSIDVWLRQIAKDAGLPYQIERRAASTVFRLKLQNGMCVEAVVPHKSFQYALAGLPDVIKQYAALQNAYTGRVTIRGEKLTEKKKWASA